MSNFEGFVYHYTSARTAIDCIIRNKTLRMGRLAGVNDPKESKYRNFVFYARGAKAVSEFESSYFDHVCSDLANNTFALCCGLSSVGGAMREDGALHPHMWANYGGLHTGVCIVLKKEMLNERVQQAAEGEKVFSGEVDYHDFDGNRTLINSAYSLYLEDWLKDRDGYFDFHVCNYYKGLFFSKHKDWRDEKEYRWVARSRSVGPIFVDISDVIEKVVVGSDVSEADYFYLHRLCKEGGIPLHRVTWNASGSLSADLCAEGTSQGFLNLEMSYSQNVPCQVVLNRITNEEGSFVIIGVSGRNGNIVYCGKDKVESAGFAALGFADNEIEEIIEPVGFSAGRWAEIDSRRLLISVENGVPTIPDGEEIPYYGLGLNFSNTLKSS